MWKEKELIYSGYPYDSSGRAVCRPRAGTAHYTTDGGGGKLEDMETEEQIPDENKECILIIDDNADVRDYVKSLLKEEYTVIEAPDGRAGLKKAMKYVPDAIICDVMMPVMDGLECCRKLKTELQTSHIPVMLLTACSLDEQRIQGFECGRILISPNPLIPNCCWYVFVI